MTAATTDCIAIAAPDAPHDHGAAYAGKHTVIGAAVHDVTRLGIVRGPRERAARGEAPR